jgi:four helix bundle protein
MGIRDYKELLVWQKAMELVTEVYRLVKLLPKEETYALSDQMRRAAVSIPSNIAEGYNRNTDKELIQFFNIARGSCAELETQILIGRNLEYLSIDQSAKAMDLCMEIRKMLNSFIAKCK